MRQLLIAAATLANIVHPALAQTAPHRQPTGKSSGDATSDAKRAEISALIERAQRKQAVVDARNTQLWERWTYAVCVGCGPVPKNLRIVHTTPERVLAGIPAADDDARERAATARSRRI